MLGVVKDGKIINFGKWIVKFFLDLNLGVFVYNVI